MCVGGEIGQYRKAFEVKAPVLRATAYIVGLGYYQLYMNGNKISSHELGAFTTFEERYAREGAIELLPIHEHPTIGH
jgi:hypothetical protein|eukprot:COSAG02_NODE_6693_length_3418_cov_2.561615_2_plen_77_part_00